MHSVAYAFAAAIAVGAMCAAGPAILRALPEPDSRDEDEIEPDTADDEGRPGAQGAGEPVAKVAYADLAARSGLRRAMVVAGAIVGAIVGWLLGGQPILLAWAYLAALGVVLAYIDWQTHLLPTRLIVPSYGIVAALILLAAALDGSAHDLLRALFGLVAMRSLYWVQWFVYPRGLGFGDVRLSGLLGMASGYVGWAIVIAGVYGAYVLGGLGALVLLAAGRSRKHAFAFGPFMLVGCLAALAWGQPLADWYLNRS